MPSASRGGGREQAGGGAVGSGEDHLTRSRLETFREDASIRHICDMNGVTEEVFAKKVETVDTLEIFMTIPVSLSGLHEFSGLKTLRVIKQPDVRVIEGLEDAKKLEGLWVCECNLETTANLDKCMRLEKLFLTSNRLTQLEQMQTLTNLQQLWLNDNKLTSLAGLESLVSLRQLWAARNQLQRVGTSLSKCTNLTDLNLADNRIGCFREVLNLRCLDRLQSLSLTDPHFGGNPVANLCNYQTLVIFHLTQLTQLDMRGVTDKSKHMAQSIFLKKRMYYNMRIRTLKRNAGNLMLLAETYLRTKSQGLLVAFKEVMKQLKDCEYAVEELACGRAPAVEAQLASGTGQVGGAAAAGEAPLGEAAVAAAQQLEDRQRTLGKVAGIIETRLATMDMSLDVARDAVHHVAARMVKNLMMEFNTGGNIRLEEGSEKESWYSNFRHFVQSSFHTSDYEGYGISEIDVNRIVRLHNRLLRQRFDARVKEVVKRTEQQQQEGGGSGGSPKNAAATAVVATGKGRVKPATAVEYLFLRITEPMIDSLEEHVSRLAEEGFPASGGEGPAIRLSTTVWDADLERLRARSREVRHGVRDVTDSCLVGRLLVVKIFRGRCLEIEAKEDEFHRLYGPPSSISSTTFPGYQSLSLRLTDRPGPRQWYMLDPTLVVPEFIVDFDYVRKSDREHMGSGGGQLPETASVEERLQCLLREVSSEHDLSFLKAAQDQVMDLRPFSLPILRFSRKVSLLLKSYNRLHLAEQQQIMARQMTELPGRPQPPVSVITEPELFRVTRAGNLSSLTYLNLHSQGIERIENLGNCRQLRRLVLSFNAIGRMEGLDELSALESLDLSFNRIKKLEGVAGLQRLSVLNLQHNDIDKLEQSDPEYLHHCLPRLTDFTIRHNPVCRIRNARLHFLRAFPGLSMLDGTKVTEKEQADLQEHSRFLSLEQIRKFALRSRPSAHLHETLPTLATDLDAWKRANDSTATPPAALLLLSVEEGKDALSGGSGVMQWLDSVEELFVDSEGIQKLQHLERLGNLRRASFAHNDLTSMEGLQGCTALEELSLEDNHITQVEHLEQCTRLKRLDLGSNALTSVSRLEGLINLTQLSLENNEISTLAGLGCLPCLMELYLANNLVARTSELDALRNIARLIILDLSGNPICQTSHYRTYTVYRLRWLKVLDGKPVTSREMGDSHKIFEGKLTYDGLVEKIKPASFEDLQELDLSNCRLRDVDILGAGDLEKLRELVLDNNMLTHFQWAKGLTCLTFLSLNGNRIEGFAPPGQPRFTTCKENFLVPVGSLPELEVLQVGHNRIVDLRDLELHHFPNLAVLHVHNNDIGQVCGLHHCTLLRELVLDHNKVRQLDASSFCGLSFLQEVRMESNGLRSLAHFGRLPNLQVLQLGNNRISELLELERLGESDIRHPVNINLHGNPVCRKPRYRNYLLTAFPSLQVFDGRSVSDDERDRTVIVPVLQDSLIKRFFSDVRLSDVAIPASSKIQQPAAQPPQPLQQPQPQLQSPASQVKVTSLNMAESLRYGSVVQDQLTLAGDGSGMPYSGGGAGVSAPLPKAPRPEGLSSFMQSTMPTNARKLERTSSASSQNFLRARKGDLLLSSRPRVLN